MQTLSAQPSSLLDLIAREGGLEELATLSPGQKSDLFKRIRCLHMY